MSHHPNWDAPSSPAWTAPKAPKRETLIGVAIRAWCQRNRISQSRLAERLDVEHTYISRIVSGERTPSRDLAMRIADELGIDHPDMALMLCDIDPASFRQQVEHEARSRIVASITAALEAA